MGQDESRMVDESTPTETLGERTVEAVAKFIASGHCRRIVVMTGAGLSTSAGIPDFRSPETGLYANLQRLNLPYAEAVFDISYFRKNPLPFYTLAHELYPGRYRPTIAHSFIRLLYEKGLLLKLFTQNIDCLEREAGVPDGYIIEAHGSFAKQRCIECRTEFPDDRMHDVVQKKEVPHCLQDGCRGLVKPDIVFFGESLPEEFFKSRNLPGIADLCIVMGTSLTVQPFASLPELVSEGVPRVLLNKERVGGFGSRPDDVLMLGDCDSGVRRLATHLGWLEELEKLWAETAPEAAQRHAAAQQAEKEKTQDELLDDEIQKITKEVDESLKLSKEHTDWVKEGLGASGEKAAKPATEAAVAAGDAEAKQKPHEDQTNTSGSAMTDKQKVEAKLEELRLVVGEAASTAAGKLGAKREEHTEADTKEEGWETDSNGSNAEADAGAHSKPGGGVTNETAATKDTSKRDEKPSL